MIAALYFQGAAWLATQKPMIEARLSQELGFELSIDHLKIEFIPRLNIEAKGIRPKVVAGCSTVPLLKELSMIVDIPELLRRSLVIREVVLSEPRVRASFINHQLRLSTLGESPCELVPSPHTPNKDQEAPSSSGWTIEVQQIQIDGGRIIFNRAGGETILDDLDFVSGYHRNGDIFELASGKLSAKLNQESIVFSTEKGQLDPAGQIKITGAKLTGSWGTTELDANIGIIGEIVIKNFSSDNLDLKRAGGFLNSLGFNLPRLAGLSTFNMSGDYKPSTGINLSGSVILKNLSAAGVTLESAEIRDLTAAIKDASEYNASATLTVRTFKALTTTEGYSADSISWPISIKADPKLGTALTGTPEITGFAYRDEMTEVSKVNAVLNDFRGRLSPKGETEIKAVVDGSSVSLSHPHVSVESIQRIRSPITVLIPQKGYRIFGPIVVEGATGSLLDRKLSHISGSVDLEISDPKQVYTARGLKFRVENSPGEINGKFQMRRDNFDLNQIIMKIAGGTIRTDATARRSSELPFSGSIAAKDLDLTQLTPLIGKEIGEEFKAGKIGIFDLEIAGSRLDFQKSLVGKGVLRLVGGKLQRFELTSAIRSALNSTPLFNFDPSLSQNADWDERRQLDVSFVISDRSIQFSNLLVRRSGYDAMGKGKLGFDETIDARLKIVLMKQNAQQLGLGIPILQRVFGDIAKIEIPLIVTGDWGAPSVTVDLATLARDNSGVTLIQRALGEMGSIGSQAEQLITSPFRSKSTPTQTPQP